MTGMILIIIILTILSFPLLLLLLLLLPLLLLLLQPLLNLPYLPYRILSRSVCVLTRLYRERTSARSYRNAMPPARQHTSGTGKPSTPHLLSTNQVALSGGWPAALLSLGFSYGSASWRVSSLQARWVRVRCSGRTRGEGGTKRRAGYWCISRWWRWWRWRRWVIIGMLRVYLVLNESK